MTRQLVRLVKSAAVWFVFVPQLTVLRFIGPRLSILFSRILAFINVAFTVIGADRMTRQSIDAAYESFETTLSRRQILRRYLVSKHQRFIEWYLYPTSRGRSFVAETYRDVEGVEYLDAALAEGKGAIVLVFHFGMAKMMWPALKAHGYETHQHLFRGATYAGTTVDSVAKLAMDVLAETEANSGLNVIYHRPFFTMAQLDRLLKKNAIIGVNGDGMMGDDFVTLPFLDGRMDFPRGLARLAANTGAPIIPGYAMPTGLFAHRVTLHAPIHCEEDSTEHVDRCVKAYVDLFDSYVRRYPWEWWTWRRLGTRQTDNGETVFSAKALDLSNRSIHTPAP